jgi:hypothetical protein
MIFFSQIEAFFYKKIIIRTDSSFSQRQVWKENEASGPPFLIIFVVTKIKNMYQNDYLILGSKIIFP